jgi:mono/diheme cytochrome c family protein
MPAFDWKLDDSEVASVATYVRNAWGNSATQVQGHQVAKLRSLVGQSAEGHARR